MFPWTDSVHTRCGSVCARAQPVLRRATQRAWGLSGEPWVGEVLLPGGGAGPARCCSVAPSVTLRAPQLHVQNEGAGQAEGSFTCVR